MLNVNDKPTQKDEIYMYLDGNWFSLIAKAHTYNASHFVDHLDQAILSKNILDPILGIKDIRNDQRIDFIDGKQGLTSLKNAVDSGDYRVAFALKPITIEQLKDVSDQNQVMPPKSTYIECYSQIKISPSCILFFLFGCVYHFLCSFVY